jgi:hypothetical protein
VDASSARWLLGEVDWIYLWSNAGEVHAIEIKLVHPRGVQRTLAQGLEQLARYPDRLKAHSRTLVIFDRRDEARAKSWEERLKMVGGVLVVWG